MNNGQQKAAVCRSKIPCAVRATVATVAILAMAMAMATGCGSGSSNDTTPIDVPGPVGNTGVIECDTSSDACSGSHSSLFAIAHSFNDPDNTVLVRVTVPAWSTGTSWGDGVNGFFYLATISGQTPDERNYVPFNGVGVDANGDPQLPQFTFIVPVDVSAGEADTSLEISACASNYGSGAGAAACAQTLWSETFSPLPAPSVGAAPFNTSAVDLSFPSGTSNDVTMYNNGVHPAEVTLSVTGDLDDDALTWLFDHLVAFDEYGDPYTNDLFADTSDAHRSVGVLTIDEAAYLFGSQYFTKYGSQLGTPKVDLPDKQFYFYTRDSLATTAFDVGLQFIYDSSEECPGYLNSQRSKATGCTSAALTSGSLGSSQVIISPYVQVTPQTDQGSQISVAPLESVTAGEQENRSIVFSAVSSSTCGKAVNPLAINLGESAFNMPNYVIDDTGAAEWGLDFAQGLYYVLPTGFGNCDSATTPFCHLTGDYTAYVPHYANSLGAFGTLNGGSTTSAAVQSFALADQYVLGFAGLATSNSLVWFDNCGFGHIYQECSGCQNSLGTRLTLPDPPDDRDTYEYVVSNGIGVPIVLAKECCASYLQANERTETYEPPSQLDDGFGAFISPGSSLTYETLFSDEVLVIYDAATGEELFKLRLNADSPSVYACELGDWTATVGSTSPYTVDLAGEGGGEIECSQIGACPFGMDIGVDGDTVTCTATESAFLLAISEWANNLSAASIQVRAWGGTGSDGAGNVEGALGGDGALGGYASTILSPTDLSSVPGWLAYVGQQGEVLTDVYSQKPGHGGSSTIVTSRAISALGPDEAESLLDPSLEGVILIAGGGGGGGGSGDEDGTCAGAGGEAIATSGAPVSGAGQDNSGPDGNGGNSDGEGAAGGSHAGAGLGGLGGNTDWQSAGSLVWPTDWAAGMGGSRDAQASAGAGGGGGGFGGGNRGAVRDGSGTGGGGGGSWAAANTVDDATAPTTAPDSPNGDGGAVEILYDLSCDSCGLCPAGTTSVSNDDGQVSCLLAASDAYDVGSWLTSTIAIGLIHEQQEMRLTAWGGRGGEMTSSNKKGGAGGMAAMTTTAADLLAGSGTLYVYVAEEGCSKDGSSFTTGEAGACGGSSTIVIDGEELAALQADGDPGDQSVLLIAGGGGSGGTDTSGGAGGATTSTTDDHGSGAGGSGGNCGSQGAGGTAGSGGTGESAGNDGIGGRGGHGQKWIFADDSSIDEPSDWTGGEGAKGTAQQNFGGSGGGGWGGGGAGPNQSCGGGGGGGGSYAAQSTVEATYAAGSGSSPNGDDGAVEIYYELSD